MKTQNGWFLPALTIGILARRDERGSTRGQESLQFERGLDPPLLPEDHLYERSRFSADGIRYLCRLLGPRIRHHAAWSHALSVEQMVCYGLALLLQVGASLIGWRSRMKKQSHNLLHITEFVSGDKSSGRCLYLLAWPKKTQSNIKKVFCRIAGKGNYKLQANRKQS